MLGIKFELHSSYKYKITFFLIFIICMVSFFSLKQLSQFRLQPQNIIQQIATGITYLRIVYTIPRPVVLHLVEINLKDNQFQFLVTPSKIESYGKINARLTSQFLNEFHQIVAINGSYFYPFREYWLPYPNVGEIVNILGHSISNYQMYSPPHLDFPALYLTEHSEFFHTPPNMPVAHAIAGREWLLKEGKITLTLEQTKLDKPYPRTAIALNNAQQKLWLIVIDGKQPNYSEGFYLQELADYLKQLGGDMALCLDGGGSSTLVAKIHGQTVILNSPIHQGWAGRERPVANHFGVTISVRGGANELG